MSNATDIRRNRILPALTGQTPEVWGGVECTCNRVGDRYFDQIELSGHAQRLSDYAMFRDLGIRTLRFGMLWERHEREPGWRWSDEHLQCQREAGISPIVGLMHHGSGPPHTSLLDPQFPEKLAAYAESVAQRYPWLDAYTPINEPHTTARFSGMYGVWFPHHQSRLSCLRALLNQLKGTVLSMEAIRRVQPAARLIQTDDMGKISGTEQLRSVWELLDERQWLPFDLLCGMVDRHHPMFRYMRAEGLAEHEILWFSDHVCKPDVVGINYYVTSDRYIDHRKESYPGGQSAEGDFVDVETVRVAGEEIVGFGPLLKKAWNRYGKPVAVTEVHIGSTVDEQIRWACEAWNAAVRAQQQGVECVAVTIWALLGSYYWNELVTRENRHYEPGAFCLRGGRPIRTELAAVVTQMARGDAPRHPALSSPGWWRQPGRVFLGSLAA